MRMFLQNAQVRINSFKWKWRIYLNRDSMWILWHSIHSRSFRRQITDNQSCKHSFQNKPKCLHLTVATYLQSAIPIRCIRWFGQKNHKMLRIWVCARTDFRVRAALKQLTDRQWQTDWCGVRWSATMASANYFYRRVVYQPSVGSRRLHRVGRLLDGAGWVD